LNNDSVQNEAQNYKASNPELLVMRERRRGV
jgi:hypothetical protein